MSMNPEDADPSRPSASPPALATMRACHTCNTSWTAPVANCPDCGGEGNEVHEASVPGIIAKHAIITYVCRQNRTPNGAFDEAVERLRERYKVSVKKNEFARFHLVLTVER